ncbi:MAG TPA: GNAT family N-acetyltransferase [Acidimicrobiia bacterium]
MSGPFHIDGAWPATTTLRRGWGKATARPWNHLTGEGSIRLIRGNTGFLEDATLWTANNANGVVMSPALYRSATRIWRRVGYEKDIELQVMEKQLSAELQDLQRVEALGDRSNASLEEIDRLAFDDYWHMDGPGLQEAVDATPRHQVFVAVVDGTPVGYAIVGVQVGISFLQRIAVVPAHQGEGLGSELVHAGFRWAASNGATTMLLNVREENAGARSLYRSLGFVDTKNILEVLRYQA